MTTNNNGGDMKKTGTIEIEAKAICWRITTMDTLDRQDLLRDVRREIGLTQAAFAMMLGVSRNTVSRWELGQLPIDRRTVLAVRYLLQQADA